MSLTFISNCTKSSVQNNAQVNKDNVKLLDQKEFIGLVTSIVAVALTAVAVTMAVLAKNGVNMGVLNAMGSLNLHSIYALVGAAGVIFVADVATLLMKNKSLADIHSLLDRNTSVEGNDNKPPVVEENDEKPPVIENNSGQQQSGMPVAENDEKPPVIENNGGQQQVVEGDDKIEIIDNK